jgi:vacuolar-type H+-ATPase subunit E/Vma4
MNLDAFRDTVLAAAREDADRLLVEAEHDATAQVADARTEGARLLERARREGRAAAEVETGRRRSEARRAARLRILRARRDTLDQLRHRTLEVLRERRGGHEYRRMLDVLERNARQQLGGAVEVDRNPDGGGLVARVDGRRVEYRLAGLVDAELAEMGAQLAELWR